jgi:outer membrane beta-barrel protein
MRLPALAITLLSMAAVGAVPSTALAQAQDKPSNEQVIQPQVDRRPVRLPKFPSKDFEFGVFGGYYATENFGTSFLYGARLGYHVSEDIFVEAAYARSQISDENYRQVLPGGIFANPEETLTYYNLSAGYNILPGEVFIGRSWAKASQLYLIGGIGATRLLEQRKQTINFGLGLRVLPADWAAVQLDFRNHRFALDLLGRRQTTNNLELSLGLTLFF